MLAKHALYQLSYGPNHEAALAVSLSPTVRPRITQSVVGPGRLELPTSRLSGVRSNQLSYRPFLKKAGEENRTPDISLEGWGFTTKLHPHGGSDGI